MGDGAANLVPLDQYARGRAREFTSQQLEVLRQITEGAPLREICAAEGMPCKSTLMNWLASDPDFRSSYGMAKNLQAEMLTDQMREVAATAKDRDSAAAARVQIDVLKWLAAKQAPKRYGDASTLRLGGMDDSREQLSSEQVAVRLAAILGAVDKRRNK